MKKLMMSLVLMAGLVASANAEYFRDSEGTVARSNYGECVVDSQGTWNENDLVAMLSCGDAHMEKRALRIPSNQVPGGAINFDFDSIALDNTAMLTIAEVNALVPHTSETELNVIGYTDAVGTPEYNMALGMSRAIMVAEILEFPNVNLASMGEQYLLIATDKPNRENRFVEIVAKWQETVRDDRP